MDREQLQYVLDHRIEKDIHQSRITVTLMPYKDATSTKRGKRPDTNPVEADVESKTIEPPNKTPLEWLKSGLSSRTHEKSGWLKEKLLKHNLIEANPIRIPVEESHLRLQVPAGSHRRDEALPWKIFQGST
jgi:hypothetical protein